MMKKRKSPITGLRLIDLGYKPGPYFKEAMEQVNSKGLTLPDDEKKVREIVDKLVPPPPLAMRQHPVAYFINMRAHTVHERENIQKVKETMDIVMKLPTVVDGAVMPDACPAGPPGTIPVGGVVITENAIHPGMHSADICCSVMATDYGKSVHPSQILNSVNNWTHFGPGGRKDHPVYVPNELLSRIEANPFTKNFIHQAVHHMGTQGDGNHFSFVGRSKMTGSVYLVTHHGSRGFGANVYKEGIKVANKFRKRLAPSIPERNAWIPFDTQEGQDYWEALQIVRDWTKHNHKMVHFFSEIGAPTSKVYRNYWNEHNFVFKRDNLFYHAKGATPMTDDFVPDNHKGLRLIPLNMRDGVMIAGRGVMAKRGLGFAPHGAGRTVSRTAYKNYLEISGTTEQEAFEAQTRGLDIRSFSGRPDVSELPEAYKNADQIKNDILYFGLAEEVDIIKPYGCIMAGKQSRSWKRKKKNH